MPCSQTQRRPTFFGGMGAEAAAGVEGERAAAVAHPAAASGTGFRRLTIGFTETLLDEVVLVILV